MVALARLNVTSYVLCLSYDYLKRVMKRNYSVQFCDGGLPLNHSYFRHFGPHRVAVMYNDV